MPWVAWCALIGSAATAGLPPLNGFVSEWLLLQAFLFTPGLPQGYVNMLVPVAGAAVALAAALSGYVMVKFFGVVFLGQPREARAAKRTTPGPGSAARSSGSPRMRGARPRADAGARAPGAGHAALHGLRARRAGERVAVPRADRRRARELQPAPLLRGGGAARGPRPGWRCAPSTTGACARAALGLRLSRG
jgi:hypothetical protein